MQNDPEAVSAYFRWLATKRQPKAQNCVVCGTPFETRGRGLYCSGRCRIRKYRQEKTKALSEPKRSTPVERILRRADDLLAESGYRAATRPAVAPEGDAREGE